jgi:hypothetical protein
LTRSGCRLRQELHSVLAQARIADARAAGASWAAISERLGVTRQAVLPFLQEDEWELPTVEIEIDGLVSHGFLRRYRWTIDFTRMTMRFAPPG